MKMIHSDTLWVALAVVTLFLVGPAHGQNGATRRASTKRAPLAFPAKDADWPTIAPAKAGWDQAKLDEALKWAGDVGSSSVVILLNGKILAERHWKVRNSAAARLRARNAGPQQDAQGRAIEDVASVQKSVTSILVGIAQEKKLLSIHDSVSKHLGEGWSKASAEQERKITIRHLLTMSSGLTERLAYSAPPGTKWRYNTPAYSKARDCVAAAAKKDINVVTKQWLTEPLGMANSKWTKRAQLIKSLNALGFSTTARDLARFGLMMQAHGRWDGKPILADQKYLRDATTPSQKMNRSYGYLWWLNSRQRIKTAPADVYSANGALTRRLYVMPSLGLVVTRIGDTPKMDRPRTFDTEFCRRILAASPH